jgi:hypothetical protein
MLIRCAAALAGLWPFRGLRAWAQTPALPPESLATLRAMAGMVLPAALGPAGIDEQVRRFADWVRDYRPGAPLDHGYGQPRLRYAPPSPVETYVRQLRELDAAVRATGATPDRAHRETWRTLLDAALKDAGVDALPSRPAGRHVAADLMALYFNSSEANDLCYRAGIGRQSCRPITFVVDRPRPR